MDKMTFASYKFKPSDVINGLNRYFAETKAYRYLRASLEIRRGVCYNNPDCVKDIIFTSSSYEARSRLVRDAHYLVCEPEEVVGVAINWLREEHDIFYTPGMEVPVEDFDVDEAAREYEKETRVVPVARVREALGIAENSDIFQCIKYRNNQLETLRTELAAARRMNHNAIADIRKAAGMSDLNPMDLVEYIRDLVKSRRESLDRWYDEHSTVLDMKDEILKVYREIFDCSNGDPEGTDAETLQDILTEYKRVLELKDVAEEKTIKYKELARENEEKAAKYKVRFDNAEQQIRLMEEVSSERLKKCEDLVKEREKVKRMEQKLSEIQDICER